MRLLSGEKVENGLCEVVCRLFEINSTDRLLARVGKEICSSLLEVFGETLGELTGTVSLRSVEQCGKGSDWE